MWRYDAARSAASPLELAAELHLQWVRHLPKLTPAWADQERMQFDLSYEPVVLGKTMYVGSSFDNSLTAFHTETGEEKWRFYTNGPVRFAPVAHKGHIYFGSDDGCLYCLDGKNGKLVWKFGPHGSRKILGNTRLISVWPIRGGPVIVGDRVHYSVGVWPFEGLFLYSVSTDLKPGANQPEHTVTRLQVDAAPQGYLIGMEKKLLMPCGSVEPILFDLTSRKTSKFRRFVTTRAQVTDYFVGISGDYVFQGSLIFQISASKRITTRSYRPVYSGDRLYGIDLGRKNKKVCAYNLANLVLKEIKYKRKNKEYTRTYKHLEKLWEMPAEIDMLSLKAGNRLYCYRSGEVFSIDIPKAEGEAKISWRAKLEGRPSSMLAADDRLFVVTREGAIYCYGKEQVEARTFVLAEQDKTPAKQGSSLLPDSPAKEGYCLVLGADKGELIKEVAANTDMQIIAIEPDAAKVDILRKNLEMARLIGKRVTVHKADPSTYKLPPYIASLIVSENVKQADAESLVRTAFNSLRPYGGVAYLRLSEDQHKAALSVRADFPEMVVSRKNAYTILKRPGALPDAGEWTHEYGDSGNSLYSRDKLAKVPLGLLWYGGPAGSAKLFFNRHDWSPSALIKNGRMFIQGPGVLTAVDVYTGRILWKRDLPANKWTAGRRGNFGRKVGASIVAGDEALYFTFPDKCLVINPVNGAVQKELKLSAEGDEWGRLVLDKGLLATMTFRVQQLSGAKKPRVIPKDPKGITVFDTRTHEVKWSKAAKRNFTLVAAGNGRLYAYDGINFYYYPYAKRQRGKAPEDSGEKTLHAFDMKTGEVLWSKKVSFVATWLSYSREHDVLVSANHLGMHAFKGTDGADLWKVEKERKGFGHHPEEVLDKLILWKDRVIDQGAPVVAYDIHTGEAISVKHPVTGARVTWKFGKPSSSCGYGVASDHLMTFRAKHAGYFDLVGNGTGGLLGFRSGCRNSLIPANGILNAPNFGNGCSCKFSIYTSLALRHVPEVEAWTRPIFTHTSGKAVKKLGINLGAAGERQGPDGLLWVNLPSRAVERLARAKGKIQWFRDHAARNDGKGIAWVASSGAKGIETLGMYLEKRAATARKFTVRLHFAEPDALKAGERTFDVSIMEQTLLKDFDIVKEAGGPRRAVIKQFKGIEAKSKLAIAFGAKKGVPVLCGVEVVEE